MAAPGRVRVRPDLLITRQAATDFLGMAIDDLAAFERFASSLLPAIMAEPHAAGVAVDPFDSSKRVVMVGRHSVVFDIANRTATVVLETVVHHSISWWQQAPIPDFLDEAYILGRLAGRPAMHFG